MSLINNIMLVPTSVGILYEDYLDGKLSFEIEDSSITNTENIETAMHIQLIPYLVSKILPYGHKQILGNACMLKNLFDAIENASNMIDKKKIKTIKTNLVQCHPTYTDSDISAVKMLFNVT